MIKEDLVKRLNDTSACYKLTQKEIRQIVTELFGIMTKAFLEGEEVHVRGFGHFRVKYSPPYEINHPTLKQKVMAHPKYVINFDPARNLKQKLRLEHEPTEEV